MIRNTTLLLGSAAIALALTAPAFAQDVAREDTVIFDLDRTIQDPENFNWMTDGSGIRRMQGAHQTMWEPLFILNYSTGELEPWLGLEATSDDGGLTWTLTLREGVTWSDGEAFDADDVVFSVEMAMGNEELTERGRNGARPSGQRGGGGPADGALHAERGQPALRCGELRHAHFRVIPCDARARVVSGGKPGDVYLLSAHRHGALCVGEHRHEPRDLVLAR